MGHNKLENQIKEKLDAREIQPSAQAWDRLDAMLTIAEEKKTKRSFGWLYIAAGILVLLSLGLFLFNPKSTEINTHNEVVGTETVKDSTLKNDLQLQAPLNNKEAVAVSSDNRPASINNHQSNNNQSVSINNQKTANNAQGQNNQQPFKQNPLINRSKDIEYQISSDVALKDLPKVEEKRAIALPRNSLSDEQLLAGLDKAAKETANKQAGINIDAKSLLSQVDGELEQTFREKVISRVRKNYKEVKVALANRNNE